MSRVDTYARRFNLANNIDESRIEAEFKDGVVSVSIAKANLGPQRSGLKSIDFDRSPYLSAPADKYGGDSYRIVKPWYPLADTSSQILR